MPISFTFGVIGHSIPQGGLACHKVGFLVDVGFNLIKSEPKVQFG